MKLYVANSTRQDMYLHMRLPQLGEIQPRISSGRQIELKDLTEEQMRAAIAHITRYGARSRDNLRGKIRDFDGIIYSDKPITEDEYLMGNEAVLEKAQDRSITEATKAAMGADMIMRNNPLNGKPQRETVFKAEQERPVKGKKKVEMEVTVSKDIGRSDKLPLQ